MKTIFLLMIFISSTASSAKSDKLHLRGLVQETVDFNFEDGHLRINSNNPNKVKSFKITRKPSSLIEFEHIEIVTP